MKFAIRKHGIAHEYRAPFLRGWLCKLGFHRWNYWHMAVSFIQMLPNEPNVCRHCEHCGWMEMTHDGVTFMGRV